LPVIPIFFNTQQKSYTAGKFSEKKNRQNQQKNQRQRKSEVKKNHVWAELPNTPAGGMGCHQLRFAAVKFVWLYFHSIR
jgi:hypothetical protein